MKFKIGKTYVNISFSFFALILLSCVWNDSGVFFVSIAVSFFHELVHLFFIIIFGASVSEIRFSVAGGEIVRGNDALTSCREAIISLSAPLTNIFIGMAMLMIDNDNLWGEVNLVVGAFNLLPYDTFDGGRGIRLLLQGRIDNKALDFIIAVSSFLICFSFLAINGVLLKNHNGNIFFLGMSLFLLILLVFRLFSKKEADKLRM